MTEREGREGREGKGREGINDRKGRKERGKMGLHHHFWRETMCLQVTEHTRSWHAVVRCRATNRQLCCWIVAMRETVICSLLLTIIPSPSHPIPHHPSFPHTSTQNNNHTPFIPSSFSQQQPHQYHFHPFFLSFPFYHLSPFIQQQHDEQREETRWWEEIHCYHWNNRQTRKQRRKIQSSFICLLHQEGSPRCRWYL